MNDIGKHLEEKYLRKSEIPLFMLEVKRIKKGKKKTVVAVLVSDRETQRQHALLVFKAGRFQKFSVRVAVPILSDFTVSVTGDLQVEFHSESCVLCFEALTEQDMTKLVSTTTKAIQIAHKDDFRPGGGSHQWVGFYRPAKQTDPAAPQGKSPSIDENDVLGQVNRKSSAQKDDNASEGSPALSETNNSSMAGDLEATIKDASAGQNSQSGAQKKYNPLVFSYIRDEWIKKQMRAREDEFTETKKIKVYIGTYNVNGKKPGEDIDDWIDPKEEPDIVVVGFQEIVELTAQNMIVTDTQRIQVWEDSILNTLNSGGKHRYEQLTSRILVGLMLVCYIRTDHLPHLSDMQTNSVGVGIMNMMGNKGGVGIRFRFYDSDICFVNSHLDADKSLVERRNQDYKEITQRMKFGTGDSSVQLFDHDHIFWLGDLNYRLSLGHEEVHEKIREKDWPYLLKYDQLIRERTAGNAFQEFTEGTINFAPTYKFDPQTDRYDTSEKKRTPAWCDRVLWRGENIKQLFYRRHGLLTSDHKPVSSAFDVGIKAVVREKQQETYQSIVRMLDVWENEYMPNIAVDKNVVAFPNIRYGVPIRQNLILENTGQVIVQFRFIPKLEEKYISKPWLSVTPKYGMIIPGEKLDVTLDLLVDQSTASDLYSGKDTLDDILILHLENGRDYFVTVTGEYLKSCFGCSLEQLALMTEPVRTAVPKSTGRALSMPKEIWRIVDFIYQNGLNEVGIFQKSGIQNEMENIRECLDTGEAFQSFNVHSMAETLIRFLETIPEPVIPFAYYQQAVDNAHSPSLSKQVVSLLPSINYNVFVYITAFLREALRRREENHLTPEKLGVVFSNCLLRSEEHVMTYDQNCTEQRKRFLLHFLQEEEVAAEGH